MDCHNAVETVSAQTVSAQMIDAVRWEAMLGLCSLQRVNNVKSLIDHVSTVGMPPCHHSIELLGRRREQKKNWKQLPVSGMSAYPDHSLQPTQEEYPSQ